MIAAGSADTRAGGSIATMSGTSCRGITGCAVIEQMASARRRRFFNVILGESCDEVEFGQCDECGGCGIEVEMTLRVLGELYISKTTIEDELSSSSMSLGVYLVLRSSIERSSVA